MSKKETLHSHQVCPSLTHGAGFKLNGLTQIHYFSEHSDSKIQDRFKYVRADLNFYFKRAVMQSLGEELTETEEGLGAIAVDGDTQAC